MRLLRRLPAVPAIFLLFGTAALAIPVDTSFTYQGELTDSVQPVDGVTCDFQFGLWDAEAGGSQVGASPIARSASVASGLFAVDLDFGAVFDAGEKRWLEIEVQCPGDASFTTLSPRTEVKGAPQAQFAAVSETANAVAWAGISGVPADIADGDDVDDADASPSNEIQNLFATVQGDSGSTTADTATDTISIVGDGSISTAVSGDTITISASSSASGQIVGGGSAFNSGGTSDNFLPMAASGRTADYDGVATRIPVAGTITDMAGMLSAATAAGSYTFTVMKNGADTSVTCSVSGAATLSCSDLSNCASFSAGDTMAVRATGSGADNRILRWNGVFTPGGTCL